jgi:poly-gamma-glutamate synthesis protein (capsule biosynthesis protein)
MTLVSKLVVLASIAVAAIIPLSFVHKEAKILFVGDMMLDRTIRTIGDKQGYDHLFSCVGGYLSGFDAVVGNLEGPITPAESKSLKTKPGEPGNTTFTFDPKVVSSLSKHNIKFVSLGNNHIMDFGREGLEITQVLLDKQDIVGFGSPIGSNAATTTINGKRIAFVAYNKFLGQSDPKKTIDTIAKLDPGYQIVVYAHWGEEYVPANETEKNLAHQFIDAGADLVIGSHPHVIQEHEEYKGRHIYYSLGNFIFDQYWIPEVRIGQGVEATFSGDTIKVKDTAFDISRDGTTCPGKAIK